MTAPDSGREAAVCANPTPRQIRDALIAHQANTSVHPLTCGNDSSHPNLVPVLHESTVRLLCEVCEWDQPAAQFAWMVPAPAAPPPAAPRSPFVWDGAVKENEATTVNIELAPVAAAPSGARETDDDARRLADGLHTIAKNMRAEGLGGSRPDVLDEAGTRLTSLRAALATERATLKRLRAHLDEVTHPDCLGDNAQWDGGFLAACSQIRAILDEQPTSTEA